MTQIEKISTEIERLKEIGCPLQKGCDYQHGYDEFYTQIKNFINSLQVEQPNEDVEKFIQNLIDEYPINKDCVPEQSLNDYYQGLRFGVLQGTQWQKEQMMKGFCYETTVYRDEEGDGIDTPIESWLALENNEITNLPNIGLKEGDKVKILIIKENKQ